MHRHLAACALVTLTSVAVAVPPASAQFTARTDDPALVRVSGTTAQAVVQGVVHDEEGRPLAGAVVSAFGSTSVFAVSDPDGRFAFRNVPYGPYVVRAHLQGYVPARGRVIQVNSASLTVSAISLTRREAEDHQVLAAGVGGADPTSGDDEAEDGEGHDHGEVAWRLRHLKRSVLKDAVTGFVDGVGVNDFAGDPREGLEWAIGTPVKLASFLADVRWNGQLDLLTTTSFDRPQELFSMQAGTPRGVAFVALEAPTGTGRWTMRGAVNQVQGDLSSWILAASFERGPAAHRYEAGLSYGTQSYRAATSRSAAFDTSRNVGSVYAYDDWTITPRMSVNFGAKYARYDYLNDRGLFSPRVGVTVMPTADETFKLKAAVSRRAVAPGAEEFIPPATGLWLPPERTFSALSARDGFRAERVDHLEVAAEREWAGHVVTSVRVFRQEVSDQLVTMFGSLMPGSSSPLGHYYVASAGDFGAVGWGVSVRRRMADRLHASVDYTNVDAAWAGSMPSDQTLTRFLGPLRHDAHERFHDVTATIDSVLPVTDARLFVVYKVNSRFEAAPPLSGEGGSRFDVQLTQALPFLNFAGAELEMLMAIRSLFREDLLDASVYDEPLVVRPPKRIVGGVTVRF